MTGGGWDYSNLFFWWREKSSAPTVMSPIRQILILHDYRPERQTGGERDSWKYKKQKAFSPFPFVFHRQMWGGETERVRQTERERETGRWSSLALLLALAKRYHQVVLQSLLLRFIRQRLDAPEKHRTHRSDGNHTHIHTSVPPKTHPPQESALSLMG